MRLLDDARVTQLVGGKDLTNWMGVMECKRDRRARILIEIAEGSDKKQLLESHCLRLMSVFSTLFFCKLFWRREVLQNSSCAGTCESTDETRLCSEHSFYECSDSVLVRLSGCAP